jgi:hypothetical protein
LLATELDDWRRSARKSRRERIRKTVIREKMKMEKTILERIEQKQLQWYCHVKRKENHRFPKTIMQWETEGRRSKGTPLGTWIDCITYSMEKYGLRAEYATYRKEWRRKNFQQKFLFVLFNGLTLHAFLLLYLVEENFSSEEIPKEEYWTRMMQDCRAKDRACCFVGANNRIWKRICQVWNKRASTADRNLVA